MFSPKNLLIGLTVFIVLGSIAKGWNDAHDLELAVKECGSKANIERVDHIGFVCKEPNTSSEQGATN